MLSRSKDLYALVLGALFVAGCGASPGPLTDVKEPDVLPASMEHALTTAYIGCPHEEIEITSKFKSNNYPYAIWTAECRGKTYYCGSFPGVMNCSEDNATK